MPRILRTAISRTDIVDILLFLRSKSPGIARRVHSAIDHTLHFLSENPLAGQKRDELGPRLRSFPVSSYRNYLVFYRPLVDGIEVIRVLHGARNLPKLLDRR